MKVIDMHCDTITRLFDKRRAGEEASLADNSLHIDLRKMKKGGYLLQNFAIFTDLGREEDPLSYAMQAVDVFYSEIEKQAELIGAVASWDDIEKNQREGRLSALLTVEDGGICLGKVEILRDFYRLGVRMMTLTWNYPNELGFPNHVLFKNPMAPGDAAPAPDACNGLTECGIAFVQEMERIGMIIDISHLGDAGVWDVFRHTGCPVVASHSNCRALAGHPRNLTDEMLRALAERGGVAGINFCASFLRDEEDGREPVHSRCQDMVRHMRHMRDVGGIGCIGLGSDFDGIGSEVEFTDCSGIQMLADEMHRQGFSDSETEKVFSGNVLRVYREILK